MSSGKRKIVQAGNTLDDQEMMIQLAQRLGMGDAFPWGSHQELTDWVLEGTGLTFDEFCEKSILTGKARYYAHEEETGSESLKSMLCKVYPAAK